MRNSLAVFMSCAAALLSAATPAVAFDRSQIGAWSISQSPESGICTGVTGDREAGLFLVMISPDGGNQGGFVFSGRGVSVGKPGETTLQMRVGGKMEMRQAFGIAEDGSELYFIPFDVASEMNQFDDAWTFEVAKDSKTMISLPLKDFKGAKSLFDKCTAERATFKRPS